MFRICAVLAIGFLEPREAAESIANRAASPSSGKGTSPKYPLVTTGRATDPGRVMS